MILVTVGTHTQAFDRLLLAADALAGQVQEEVVIQRGVSTCPIQHAQSFDFVDEAAMRAWVEQARVVISHAGAGSILDALVHNRPLVLAPRLAHYGEVVDDHQLELAQALAQRGKAMVVDAPSADTLHAAIEEAVGLSAANEADRNLHHALRAWLDEQAVMLTRARRRRSRGASN